MKRQSGFTLLEVLVVISLMGLLLGLVGTAMVAARSAVVSAEQTSGRLDDLRASQRFLRRSISQALPLSVKQAGADQAGSFQGQPTSLSFYAPLPASLGGGLYRQRVALNKHQLQVYLARLEGRQLEAWGEPQPLLDEVTRLRFRYQGRSPLGETTQWLERWPWPERLPRAVRIEWMTRHGQRPIELQINLKLELSGGGA